MSEKPIRVLVVEDSLTIRKRLVEILEGDPGFQVVGEAEDGRSAIEACQRLRPDVVTLDMMLPVMTGLAATEYIMAYCPTPILIVSASVNRGELFRTYDALAAGALDVLEKPSADDVDDAWERRYRDAVRRISRVPVITHLRARLASRMARRHAPEDAEAATAPAIGAGPARRGAECSPRPAGGAREGGIGVIALGASTGAPAALKEVLTGLPPDFPLPILVVVHLSAPFASAFADWLDGVSPVRVTYAADGEPLPLGGRARVLLAPPDRHLELSEGRLRLRDGPERHSCRPSVDVLFESLARDAGARAAACLMTGMGRDGADGLLAIRRAGGTTIAQDEQTSVVFGMPREAIGLGAAERVLPLGEIAPALIGLAAGDRGRRGS